jgi:hypothetical protein
MNRMDPMDKPAPRTPGPRVPISRPPPLPPPSGIPSEKVPTGLSLDGLIDFSRVRDMLKRLFRRG